MVKGGRSQSKERKLPSTAGNRNAATKRLGKSPHPLDALDDQPNSAFREQHAQLLNELKELAEKYDALRLAEIEADTPWITEPVAAILQGICYALEDADYKRAHRALRDWADGPMRVVEQMALLGEQDPSWLTDRASGMRVLLDRLERDLGNTAAASDEDLPPLGALMKRGEDVAAAVAVQMVTTDLVANRERHQDVRTLMLTAVLDDEYCAEHAHRRSQASAEALVQINALMSNEIGSEIAARRIVLAVLRAFGHPTPKDLLPMKDTKRAPALRRGARK